MLGPRSGMKNEIRRAPPWQQRQPGPLEQAARSPRRGRRCPRKRPVPTPATPARGRLRVWAELLKPLGQSAAQSTGDAKVMARYGKKATDGSTASLRSSRARWARESITYIGFWLADAAYAQRAYSDLL